MDKGFFSTRNVNAMLNGPEPTRFVIAMPFTSKFAQKMVESERKDIDCLDKTLVIGEQSLRAVTKKRAWGKECQLYTHVYYDAIKGAKMSRRALCLCCHSEGAGRSRPSRCTE